MTDLKAFRAILTPESDFWLLVILWAIAFYLYFSQLYLTSVERLEPAVGLTEVSSDSTLWTNAKRAFVIVLSLVPFFVLGLAGHLFFWWGFGHIWSVSLSIFGCISGAIYELIRQNDTLGSG